MSRAIDFASVWAGILLVATGDRYAVHFAVAMFILWMLYGAADWILARRTKQLQDRLKETA